MPEKALLWRPLVLDARNERRRELLDELVARRNAIAHQDFDPVALARDFDRARYNCLRALLGAAPW